MRDKENFQQGLEQGTAAERLRMVRAWLQIQMNILSESGIASAAGVSLGESHEMKRNLKESNKN